MFNKPILYINETFRSLPFTSIFFTLLISILFQSKISLILCGLLVIDNGLNKIFKYLSERYIKYGGLRPKGAKNCGCFLDLNNINKLATSYGMPSGHTQNIFFIATFLSCYFNSFYKTIILYLIASYGGYLRIKFNCHTQLQVFIGGIIGIILGYIFYKLMLISNII